MAKSPEGLSNQEGVNPDFLKLPAVLRGGDIDWGSADSKISETNLLEKAKLLNLKQRVADFFNTPSSTRTAVEIGLGLTTLIAANKIGEAIGLPTNPFGWQFVFWH